MVKKSDPTEYYRNAAKQIKWKLNYNIVNGVEEKYIDVPAAQWDEAKDDIMVQHLMGLGFVLQDCIPMPETKIFDPVIITKNMRPKPKDKPKEGFVVGDKFEIVSSGDRLEITNNQNGISLSYLNVGKANIKMPLNQLERSLAMGTWKRI